MYVYVCTHTYTMEYYSAIKKNETLPYAAICRDLENIIACQYRRCRFGWQDPLEEETANHSSVLAWEIPWTEEPGRLWSIGSQKCQDLTTKQTHDIHNILNEMLDKDNA